MRLVYLIHSINILEDSQYLVMFESAKRNKLWIPHQAIDGKKAINMYVYGKNDDLLQCCEGLIGVWRKERVRDNISWAYVVC